MANPTVPFSWQMPEPTDLVTNLPADFEVFGQAVATDLQYLLGGTTGQVLAKASGTDLDFVWSADAAGMTNPMTTTADVIYSSSGSTPARLGIGTAGQILTVNSGATAPEWAAPAASGGMTLISETSASALSSLSFTSIAGTYKQLLLMYSGIRHSDGSSEFSIRLNANSGSIYHTAGLQVTATTINISGNSPSSISGQSGGYYIYSFGEGVNNSGLSTDLMGYILIDNYASSTKAKSINAAFNYFNNGDGVYHAFNTNVLFDSTSAITSLDITRLSGSGTFSNTGNTTIRLYGVS
jgi:hypothetical protein